MNTQEEVSRIVNSVSVETPQGYKTFILMHGDITQIATDLLVLSAYGDGNSSPEGLLVRSLRQRHGIVVAPEPRWLNFSDRCWTCFQEQEGDAPFSAILTLFISQLAWNQNPLPIFEDAVQGVFASLAALEYKGRSFASVSLPVLYGHRIRTEHSGGVALYPRLIEILIRHALRWLKKSEHTHTVQFVVYEKEHLSAWDEAMNKTMGRSLISAGADAVLKSLCAETRHLAQSQTDGRLRTATERLHRELAHEDTLVIENVCVSGRLLVEAMVGILLTDLPLKTAASLLENIETLRKSEKVAPWIVSYMHSLRIFGNETAHVRGMDPTYRPSRLEKADLVSALSAIRSLLTCWPAVAERGER